MKLGAVLEKYALSKDQMYFYIKYGLLVPPRRNGQYIFDDAACADIEKVLELKRLGFPLKEIHRILSLYRVSHLAGANDAAELRGIYERQLAQLAARELEIKASISELREKTAAIGERISSSCIRRGVPLRMLQLGEPA